MDRVIVWGGALLFCIATWRAVIWLASALATGDWSW